MLLVRDSRKLQYLNFVTLTNMPQYFITPISAINFRDEEIEISMGDGEGGKYSTLLKKVDLSIFDNFTSFLLLFMTRDTNRFLL